MCVCVCCWGAHPTTIDGSSWTGRSIHEESLCLQPGFAYLLLKTGEVFFGFYMRTVLPAKTESCRNFIMKVMSGLWWKLKRGKASPWWQLVVQVAILGIGAGYIVVLLDVECSFCRDDNLCTV